MSNPSILVVDDDLDIVSNVTDILTDIGYQVDGAHNGTAALNLVQQRNYDVALLDFKMPDMDGATLYQRIRVLQPELVAIMITAYAGDDGIERAKNAGTWKVLRKPVDFPQLLALVAEVVTQPLVMVVDDDTEFCENIWQILRDKGYRVGLAHDKNEASQRLRLSDYRVLLVDLQLGNETCESLIACLHELAPHASTLLVTGHRSDRVEVIDSLLKRGVKTVCYKPLDMPALLNTIEQLV